MADEIDRIYGLMNQLSEVKRSICNSKPDSIECSDFTALLDKSQELVAKLKATKTLRDILDTTIIKTDPSYLTSTFAFEKEKQKLIIQFDEFVTKELKATADDVVQKSQQQDRQNAKGESGGFLNKAKQYIRDADNAAETFTKAKYLVGAIKFGLSLLVGIHLP